MERRLIDQKNEYEALNVQAQQLGISDERFREIVQLVEDMALCSETWGRLDEQLAEIRRRIINEGH